MLVILNLCLNSTTGGLFFFFTLFNEYNVLDDATNVETYMRSDCRFFPIIICIFLFCLPAVKSPVNLHNGTKLKNPSSSQQILGKSGGSARVGSCETCCGLR